MNIPARTLREVSTNPWLGPNFTVHHYENSIHPSEDQLSVLAQGYRVMSEVVCGDLNWTSPNAVPSISRKRHVNSFTLGQSPPGVVFIQEAQKEIKEWGAQATEDEIYNLDDLEQFIGTHFAPSHYSEGLLMGGSFSQPLNQGKQGTPTKLPIVSAPMTRNLDIGSLYRIVPLPHLYPSPVSSSQRLLKGKPYNKAEPIFVAPYTAFSLPDDARIAWLIPIRGKLPWDSCTSSQLLDSSQTSAPLSCESGSTGEILWTRDSVAKLWDFLLELRRTGPLGPLGVSFHASNSLKCSNTATSSTTHPSVSHPMISDASTTSNDSPTSLSTVDYIKVYLDAPSSFHVRSALDLWSYQAPSADGHSRKIRVLKSARLALLDDCSQPVLVS